MRARDKVPSNFTARHIPVIDVGGSHVKLRIDARGPIRKFVSAGAPGLPPTWCSRAKEMVGCSRQPG